MFLKLLLLIILFPVSSGADSKKPLLKFIDPVVNLTPKQAQKIWKNIENQLQGLKGECKNPSLQKIKTFTEKMNQLGIYAGKTYKENEYSFAGIKVKDKNRDKIVLDINLKKIESLLSDEKMNYKKIKDSKNALQACKKLRENFTFSYSTYYNIGDNVNFETTIKSWIKDFYDSLNCLCQIKEPKKN